MKKTTMLTGLLTALMLLFAAVGALCGALYTLATDETLYGASSREAVAQYLAQYGDNHSVAGYIGLSEQEQLDVAKQIAAYLRDAQGAALLDPVIEREGTPVSVFNAREQQHMQDVRGLIHWANRVSKGCISLSAALAVVIAWTGARIQKRRRTMAWGALGGAALLGLLAAAFAAAMGTVGFERLFVGMHHLLFTNDLWLLDPRTDLLIRMMPQTLFESALHMLAGRTLVSLALVCALLGVILTLVGGMVRRHLAEREKA